MQISLRIILQIVDGSTPILPFLGPSGEYVTGDSLRDLDSFTYTYDDAKRYKDLGLTPEELREEVVRNTLDGGDYKDAYTVKYSLVVNANANDLPSSGGKIHVFLLPEEQPSIKTNTSSDPSYCGSVDLSMLNQSMELSLDKCMNGSGVNFYPNLNYVQPPWGEKDILNPTRRFGKFDALESSWTVKPDSFAFIIEGPDGANYEDFVTFDDPPMTVKYEYSAGDRSYENVASVKIANEALPDELTAANDPYGENGNFGSLELDPSGAGSPSWAAVALLWVCVVLFA
jgi:hypothetical protein